MVRDIIVFTLHKSASMFIHHQCLLLCKLAGIDYHSPNLPSAGLDARKLLTDKELWRARRGCFAPLRFFVAVPRARDYTMLLHVRDPRDVLVSMFYSYCYIHPGQIEANTGYRREAAAKGIDAFVLSKASEHSGEYPGDYGTGGHVEDLIGNLPKRYRDYIDHLVGQPNVTLLKYEEMVTDYRNWLEKFIAPFPLEDRAGVTEQLVARSSKFFPKRAHDALSHLRHITPGDYRDKLQSSTIRHLDDIFADVLDALQYPRSAG